MNLPAPTALLMTGDDFRESLRAYRPRVYLDGRLVDSVADEPGFAPGINALAAALPGTMATSSRF